MTDPRLPRFDPLQPGWEKVTLAFDFRGPRVRAPQVPTGVTIDQVDSVTVGAAGLVEGAGDLTVEAGSEAIDGEAKVKARFDASAASDGEDYHVRIRVVLSSGDRIEGDAVIPVRQAGAAA